MFIKTVLLNANSTKEFRLRNGIIQQARHIRVGGVCNLKKNLIVLRSYKKWRVYVSLYTRGRKVMCHSYLKTLQKFLLGVLCLVGELWGQRLIEMSLMVHVTLTLNYLEKLTD